MIQEAIIIILLCTSPGGGHVILRPAPSCIFPALTSSPTLGRADVVAVGWEDRTGVICLTGERSVRLPRSPFGCQRLGGWTARPPAAHCYFYLAQQEQFV